MLELNEIELVAIGDELLSGATTDTNAAHIARSLESIGLRVVRKTTVGDAEAAIIDAVQAALGRTGAVIATGGLGPTKDDATKPAVARLFGRDLVFQDDLWRELEARWAPRGRIPDTNRSQAEVPTGAVVFPNPRGTAPGLAIEDSQVGLCILLPGVPGEMKVILEQSVVPYLVERTAASRRAHRRLLRTAGVAESAIAEMVADGLDDLPLDIAYLPEIDGVDIRLTYWSSDKVHQVDSLDEGANRLYEMLGEHIYAEGSTALAQVVGQLLRERNLTLAVAESCTGGLVAERLTDWPGASDFFWGGMLVYDDRAKIELLDVPETTLRQHGAVSAETAAAMVEGVRRRSGADCAVAVTGIAGPDGGSEEKSVGTVWLAVNVTGEELTKRRHYPGSRDMVRIRAAQGALDLLRRTVLRQRP